jgi:hypothetical protein
MINAFPVGLILHILFKMKVTIANTESWTKVVAKLGTLYQLAKLGIQTQALGRQAVYLNLKHIHIHKHKTS